jgi:hypothetical protein
MKRIAFISVFLSLLSVTAFTSEVLDLWKPEYIVPIAEEQTPLSNKEFKMVSCESVKLEENHEKLPKEATAKCKEQFEDAYKACSDVKISDPVAATGAPLIQLRQQIISVRKGFQSQLDSYLNCKENIESNIKTCEEEIEQANKYINQNSGENEFPSNPEIMSGNVANKKKEVEGSKKYIKFLNEDGEKDTLQNNANCVIKKSFDNYYALHQNLKFAIQDLDTGSKYADTPSERNLMGGSVVQVNNTVNTNNVNVGAAVPSAADVGTAPIQAPPQSQSPQLRSSNTADISATGVTPSLPPTPIGADYASAADVVRSQPTETAGQAAGAGVFAMMRNEIARGYSAEDYANVIRPMSEAQRGEFIQQARANGGLSPEALDGLRLTVDPAGPRFNDLLRPSETYIEGVGMVNENGQPISNENIINVSGSSGDALFDRLDADLRKTLWPPTKWAPSLSQSYYVDFCNEGRNRLIYSACSRYR